MSFHSHASSSVNGAQYFEDSNYNQNLNGNNRYNRGNSKQSMKKSKKGAKYA